MGDKKQPHVISANFTLEEFACPCCSRVSIDFRLLESLQALRDSIGKPIIVSSGFRCQKRNLEVGGAFASTHLIGLAADIIVPGMTPLELLSKAEICGWLAGFGVSEKFLHVDVRNGAREYWHFQRGIAVSCTREKIFRLAEYETSTEG